MLVAGLLAVGVLPRPAHAQGKFERHLIAAARLYQSLEYERALTQIELARKLPHSSEQEVELSLNSGQLGDGTITSRVKPVQLSELSNITALAAGGEHSLARRDDGTGYWPTPKPYSASAVPRVPDNAKLGLPVGLVE